ARLTWTRSRPSAARRRSSGPPSTAAESHGPTSPASPLRVDPPCSRLQLLPVPRRLAERLLHLDGQRRQVVHAVRSELGLQPVGQVTGQHLGGRVRDRQEHDILTRENVPPVPVPHLDLVLRLPELQVLVL